MKTILIIAICIAASNGISFYFGWKAKRTVPPSPPSEICLYKDNILIQTWVLRQNEEEYQHPSSSYKLVINEVIE